MGLCECFEGKSIALLAFEPAAADRLCEAFEAVGETCHVVRDGRAALEVVAAKTPAAIVLDVNMPEATGFEVLQTLRANP